MALREKFHISAQPRYSKVLSNKWPQKFIAQTVYYQNFELAKEVAEQGRATARLASRIKTAEVQTAWIAQNRIAAEMAIFPSETNET